MIKRSKFEMHTNDYIVKKGRRDKQEAHLGEEWSNDNFFTGFVITALSILAVLGVINFIRMLVYSN